MKSHSDSDSSEPAAAAIPVTQAAPFPGPGEAPSRSGGGGGGPFDQGLGSPLVTVLGCLGHLRSAVVYFYRVEDLDIYMRGRGTRQQNLLFLR